MVDKHSCKRLYLLKQTAVREIVEKNRGDGMASAEEVTVYDSALREGPVAYLRRLRRDLLIFRYAIYNLVLNNLRSRYRKSYLGFAWSLLNPLVTMVVMAVIFAAILKQDLRSFGLYIFSGILPWIFITNSLTAGCTSMVQAETFLRKVNVSKIIFPLASVATEGINFVFSIGSLLILALFMKASVSASLLALPFAMLVVFIFAAGLVLTVSVFNVYFRDLPYVLSVGLTLWFYSVPILYPLSLVPPALKRVLLINPLYYFIQLFQSLIYDGVFPSWRIWFFCVLSGAATCATGLILLKSKERDLVFRL